ncbi:MAG: hypothetical protein ACHQFZ_04785, partial [Acidimicrobiales bacterium]
MPALLPTRPFLTRLAVTTIALVLVVAGGVGAADSAFSSAHTVTGLPALNVDGAATIDDLSCSSNGNCGAIGTYLDGTRLTQGFVVNETNGTWGAAEEIPGLGALNAGGTVGDLLSISCPASGACTAAGYYTDNVGSHQTFLVDEHSGTWGTAVALPRSGALPINLPAVPYALSCAAPGECVAGGNYLNGTQTATESWVATESAGSWSGAIELPGSGALNAGVGGALLSLACPAVGACTAVGFYTDSSGQFQGYVANEASGTWAAAQPIPGLVTLNSGGAAIPSQVVCSSVGRCAMGGGYTITGGSSEAFVADAIGGVWGNAIEVPGSGALNTAGDAFINSIACPSNGSCEAVGFYSPTSKSESEAMVVSETGGVWGNAFEMPGSIQLNTGNFSSAYTVSCVAAGDCRAVGLYTDGSNNSQAFLSAETGGVWSSTVEAPGTATLNVEGDASLNVVSCTSDGNCSAGGQYKDGAGFVQAMAPFVQSEGFEEIAGKARNC